MKEPGTLYDKLASDMPDRSENDEERDSKLSDPEQNPISSS